MRKCTQKTLTRVLHDEWHPRLRVPRLVNSIPPGRYVLIPNTVLSATKVKLEDTAGSKRHIKVNTRLLHERHINGIARN